MWYSLAAYIKCIEILAMPYPEEYLRALIVLLDEDFVRETDANHIWWNGKSDILVSSVKGYMKDEDIERMMVGLARHQTGKIIREMFMSSQRLISKKDMVVTKVVEVLDADIHELLAKHQLAPIIISRKPEGKKVKLTMKKYPTSLLDLADGGITIDVYFPTIDKMIKKMHSIGILHGDLHAGNIVLDPVTGEIRFIDFERSIVIKNNVLSISEIQKKSKFISGGWYPPVPYASTIGELLYQESVMYKDGS